MIEGLWQLPWTHEARRRNPHSADFDCAKCKQMNDKAARQAMRCGYEVPIDGARPSWTPVLLDASHEREYTLCPGYTTKLPEVIEIARLRMHGKEGTGQLFMRGEEASDVVLIGLEVLASATNECQVWASKNPQKES